VVSENHATPIPVPSPISVSAQKFCLRACPIDKTNNYSRRAADRSNCRSPTRVSLTAPTDDNTSPSNQNPFCLLFGDDRWRSVQFSSSSTMDATGCGKAKKDGIKVRGIGKGEVPSSINHLFSSGFRVHNAMNAPLQTSKLAPSVYIVFSICHSLCIPLIS